MNAVAEARAKRDSSSVILMKVLNIRQIDPDANIAIIEGKDDIGVWSAWIEREVQGLNVEPVPAGGKVQVLEARSKIMRNRSVNESGIVFFVDKDFDNNSHIQNFSDVFCTGRYSIENYFVSDRVVHQVLKSHFGCGGEVAQRKSVLGLFRNFWHAYHCATNQVHFCCYLVRREKLQGANFPKKFSEIADVSGGIHVDRLEPLQFLAHEAGIPPDRVANHRDQFEQLDFLSDCRGKFHLMALKFFFNWLQEEKHASGKRAAFPVAKPNSEFKYVDFSMPEFASVSDVPTNLGNFLRQNLRC